MALRWLCITAVCGTVWLVLRPVRLPILPPHPYGWGAPCCSIKAGKRKREASAEDVDGAEGAVAAGLAQPEPVANLQVLAEQDSQPPTASEALFHVTENARLVHALLLQGNKPLQPAPAPAGQGGPQTLGGTVRQVAERAHWDVLREGLAAQPWQWQQLAAHVMDAKQQLASLIPARSARGQVLLAEMQDKLAQDYVEQRLAAGCDVGYLRQVFDYLVYVIKQLEAPARRADTQQASEGLLQAFAAPAADPQPAGREAGIHLDMRVRRSLEVPVTMQVRDSWVPVELPRGSHPRGGSPGSTPRSSGDTRTATPPAPSRVASPAIPDDWVLNMGSISGAEGWPSPKPRAPPSPSPSQQVELWEQVQDSPRAPRVGQPLEEMVEVRFGTIQPADQVEVKLTPGQAAQPQRAGTAGLAPVIVRAVQFVMAKARELRTDAAVARLDMVRGLLQDTSSGVDYERQRFAAATADISAAQALPRTHAWLQSACHQAGSRRQEQAVATGLLGLLQQRSMLSVDGAPETLLLDVPALGSLQNELQRLCLVAAALLIAQQLLAHLRLPPSPAHPDNSSFFAAVQSGFLAVLAESSASMPRLTAVMARLLAERSAAEGPSRSGTLDPELIARMLGRIMSHEDPVYQRVERGIVDGLRTCILERLGQPCELACSSALRNIGAESLLQVVQGLAQTLGNIAALNLAVCAPFYGAMSDEA